LPTTCFNAHELKPLIDGVFLIEIALEKGVEALLSLLLLEDLANLLL
jgi:hypothetical protein